MGSRRPMGHGSVFWHQKRKRWIGIVDLGWENGARKRKHVTALTETECKIKVDEIIEARAGTPGRVSWACLVPGCVERSVTERPVLLCEEHRDFVVAGWQRKSRTPRAASSWIYFLRNGDRIKIGRTSNVRKRVASLSQPQSAVVAIMPGGKERELTLHTRFASSRVDGSEWFLATPELEEFISSLDGYVAA